jgi:hypothetical protein
MMRDDFPWLYELGLQLYRASGGREFERAKSTIINALQEPNLNHLSRDGLISREDADALLYLRYFVDSLMPPIGTTSTGPTRTPLWIGPPSPVRGFWDATPEWGDATRWDAGPEREVVKGGRVTNCRRGGRLRSPAWRPRPGRPPHFSPALASGRRRGPQLVFELRQIARRR